MEILEKWFGIVFTAVVMVSVLGVIVIGTIKTLIEVWKEDR